MARYISRLQGQRGKVTRLGHTSILAEARGWNSGVRVIGRPDPNNKNQDIFDIYIIGGSNEKTAPLLIGTVVNGEFNPLE